jgi:hypothetical protein
VLIGYGTVTVPGPIAVCIYAPAGGITVNTRHRGAGRRLRGARSKARKGELGIDARPAVAAAGPG